MKRVLPVLLCLFSLSAFAQQAAGQRPQPSPEEMKKIMEASFGAMVPMMVKMTDAMIETMLQRGEDPATARRLAKFKRNLYDALLKEGFTNEQALRIMESTALPSASPAMK